MLPGVWTASAGRLSAAEAAGAPPESLAHWTFDADDAADGSPLGTGKRGAVAEPFRDEVPGAFVYDPLTQRSRPNRRAAVFAGSRSTSDALSVPMTAAFLQRLDGSVTLEAFVRPDPQSGGDVWLVGKSAAGPGGAELSLQQHHIPNHGVTFCGAAVRGSSSDSRPLRTNRFALGHYVSSSRLTQESTDWRHVAVVYDAEALTVTGWCDHHLTHSVQLDAPLVWDDGPLLIGGRPNDAGMTGLIDEVRVTRGALGPAQFLRARAEDLSGVSFASPQTIVPRDAGCLDVREHFGAVGDGRADDTAALNAAFAHAAAKVPLAYNTLIIPPGEYRVSGTLYCSRFIDVKGGGPERTVIRLQDGTFVNPDDPQPVLRMSSTRGAPGSHRGVNGSSISIYLSGVTIDSGRGNPGAKGLEYHSNNVGRLEDVVIRSGDGSGVLGLDLMHHDVGPALAKRVTVDGFDVGVSIRYQEYSHTLEHLTLRGQRVCGIRNQGNILALRRVTSVNRVPALVCEGAGSMATLIDSELTGGDPSEAAIHAAGGLYCLRVETAGYGRSIAKQTFDPATKMSTASEVTEARLEESIGDRLTTGFGTPQGALKLPIEETPEPPLPPVSEWVSVAAFESQRQGDDWSPALQAAIDSGAKTVYLPRTRQYQFHQPVRVHRPVERIVGFAQELHWAGAVWRRPDRLEQTDLANAAPPLLIYDEPNPNHVLVLDRLGCEHLRHASPATLVLRSSTPARYSTGAAGGKLFAEDVGGADWHFDHPQQVWVRQWNPESHQAGPCIHSRGATIWALGFKTEYESQKLLAEDGARTEILGAFIYPLGKIPPDRPIFENRDSALSVIYGLSVYQSNHRLQIRDRRGQETIEIGNDALLWPGSRARMDLYTSDARP